MKLLKAARRISAAAAALMLCAPGMARADEKTEFHGYVEFTYFDDRGIGWSGSETTLRPRAKLDVTHSVYDDIALRFAAEWTATVGPHSRAYARMAKREGLPEDVYIHFKRFSGMPFDLRMGVVKVPYGIFNTMAVDDRNRPITLARFREWDYGMRFDAPLSSMDVSLAMVNGDGREGTDANSSKSIVFRAAYPPSGGELYPETDEVPTYPNPRAANPDGAFHWQVAASGYVGDRYTTPIKQKFAHYGADFSAAWSVFSLKTQYTFFEGDFTNRDMNNWTASQWTQMVADLQLSGAAVQAIYTYPRGQSVFAEFGWGATDKSMLTVMYEVYDPDMTSDTSKFQRSKSRLVVGAKHDYRTGVTAALFYTINDNPAFGDPAVDITQSDYWKGDTVLMATVAVRF